MSRFVASSEDSIVVLEAVKEPAKPDKVVTTLEDALEGVVIESNN
jgi:hypothetical protein